MKHTIHISREGGRRGKIFGRVSRDHRAPGHKLASGIERLKLQEYASRSRWKTPLGGVAKSCSAITGFLPGQYEAAKAKQEGVFQLPYWG